MPGISAESRALRSFRSRVEKALTGRPLPWAWRPTPTIRISRPLFPVLKSLHAGRLPSTSFPAAFGRKWTGWSGPAERPPAGGYGNLSRQGPLPCHLSLPQSAAVGRPTEPTFAGPPRTLNSSHRLWDRGVWTFRCPNAFAARLYNPAFRQAKPCPPPRKAF